MADSLAQDVQEHLGTARLGRTVRTFNEVESTNAVAATWARKGAPEGAVVLTEFQTAGRGRQGRTWTADAGQNLLFSVVLRPEMPTVRLSLITVAATVAVAEAVESFVAPHTATIEWPNDVLLEGRKTCGILLESSVSSPKTDTVVVLGIGLNVNQTDFPTPLAESATSLRLTTGRTVPRAPLLARLLRTLEERYDAVRGTGADAVRDAFHNRLAALGEPLTLRVPDTGQSVSGIVEGITPTGALRLRTADGPRTVHAGEVTSQQ